MGAPRRAGCTPLVVAAMHGRADAIALLAAAGSDPDARGRKGAAAVHFAAGASPPRPAVAFGRAAYRGAAGGSVWGRLVWQLPRIAAPPLPLIQEGWPLCITVGTTSHQGLYVSPSALVYPLLISLISSALCCAASLLPVTAPIHHSPPRKPRAPAAEAAGGAAAGVKTVHLCTWLVGHTEGTCTVCVGYREGRREGTGTPLYSLGTGGAGSCRGARRSRCVGTGYKERHAGLCLLN